MNSGEDLQVRYFDSITEAKTSRVNLNHAQYVHDVEHKTRYSLEKQGDVIESVTIYPPCRVYAFYDVELCDICDYRAQT